MSQNDLLTTIFKKIIGETDCTCIQEVIKYLNIFDLIKISRTNKYYNNLFSESVIGKSIKRKWNIAIELQKLSDVYYYKIKQTKTSKKVYLHKHLPASYTSLFNNNIIKADEFIMMKMLWYYTNNFISIIDADVIKNSFDKGSNIPLFITVHYFDREDNELMSKNHNFRNFRLLQKIDFDLLWCLLEQKRIMYKFKADNGYNVYFFDSEDEASLSVTQNYFGLVNKVEHQQDKELSQRSFGFDQAFVLFIEDIKAIVTNL